MEQKVGNTFVIVGTEKSFLYRIPIAQGLTPTIIKWYLVKLKICITKDTFSQLKDKPPKWGKGLITYTLDRVLPYKIKKELRKKF